MGNPTEKPSTAPATARSLAAEGVAGTASSEGQGEQPFATGVSHPQPPQPGAIPTTTWSYEQGEQPFATGVSHPQPPQPGAIPTTTWSHEQGEQPFATGVSHPQPPQR